MKPRTCPDYHCDLGNIREVGKSRRGCPTWLLERIKLEKDLRFSPQVYKTVSEFFNHHEIPVPKKGHWRLTERLVGHISGLPLSFGHLTATDGLMCYIENNIGVYFGHLQFFEKMVLDELSKPVKTKQQKVNIFEQLKA